MNAGTNSSSASTSHNFIQLNPSQKDLSAHTPILQQYRRATFSFA